MEKKGYFLGLDMGTNSVGWAVTDAEYHVLKAKGKDLWGIREFDEAQTSADRRTHRVSRRRRQREQVRIGLLKSYFDEEIKKVDPNFYQRLENSKYFPEDKDDVVRGKNGIFADKGFTDKDYYAAYPTIYHLRKELIDNVHAPYDVRLVYLAILNMFKHRGHFLNSSISDTDDTIPMEEAFLAFCEGIYEWTELDFSQGSASDIEEILSNRDFSRSAKAEKLAERFGIEKKDKRKISVVKAICGLSIDAKVLFPEIEKEEKIEICFANAGFEEKIPELQDALGEDRYSVIESMKQLYEIGSLSGILKGKTYLSEARVEEYNKHHNDLKRLKSLYHELKTQEDYDRMFRSGEKGTYSAYVNSYNSESGIIANGEVRKKQRRNMKERSRDALYNTIKKDFVNHKEDERVKAIFAEMERETFLPKQLTSGNGIIPNQVHKKELKAILKNAEGYLPFLREKDESGLSVSERILRLFAFQIPYFVGPTTTRSAENGGNGWVVRKEEGMVLPWNLEDKIDMEKTAQHFIERLVKNCSYIADERVLPKASLLYEKYCVLNEINNIKISGEKISVELKQGLYKELFCRGKRVTRKMVEKYFVANGVLDDVTQLSGIDTNINNALLSYGKFYSLFGEELQKDSVWEMAERIIYLCTVYGDSKKMLKKCLINEFGEKLTEDQIKKVMGFRFKDWGAISKEMLELHACDKSTGEDTSLIRAMWETNHNFMELLYSNEYSFKEALEEKRTTLMKTLSDFEVEDLDEFYFSAPVKRMVWQTLQLIKEIEHIQGEPPKRVFIEMTRSDEEKGDKGRKDSRAKMLLELYKNIRDDRDWKGEIEKAEKDGYLRSKKVYLYYTQMGRCAYTGEPIDLHTLLTDNQYDIDHIYPRHYVKDDNLSNNMVLVKKSSNAYKSDTYPLPQMKPEVYDLWKMLLERKLITEEKYRRLTGRNPFTDEQKAGFIARQLVETSQGTKGVADLLKQLLKDTTVVYSKGRNVSDFRQEFDLLKSRTVNDFHHAKDAYLNIVVGNVYYVKFTQDPLKYMRKMEKEKKPFEYHLGKMFSRDVRRGDEIAWIAGTKEEKEAGTIAVVKKMMAKNTPLLTRLSFECHGGIANETLYSAKDTKEEGYIPLKGKDARMQNIMKYGGFTNVSGAYFFLVEHEEKGKKIRTLEQLPIYVSNMCDGSKEFLEQYCVEKLGLVNPNIRIAKIKMQSLIQINGYRYHLSGRTGKQIILRNAVNMCLNQNWCNYIQKVDKYNETKSLPKEITQEKNVELYYLLVEKHKNGIFSKRLNPVGKKLEEGDQAFGQLSLTEQCYLINEILRLTVIGAPYADLKLIGGAAKSGIPLFSKVVSKAEEFKMINQSITGIYEKEIDLLTV